MSSTNKKLSFAFFGTPEFATLVLKQLIAAGFSPALVVTTPDKPAGRGLALTPSPVKQFAANEHIPVLQPEKLDSAFIATLQEKNIELIITAAFGKILPDSLLAVGKYPPLNVHPSLLPKYRGTSPVESQILADEQDVGVSVIHMDAEMDHGPIVAQKKVVIQNWPISRDALNEILWTEGGRLVAEILPSWIEGNSKETPQDHTEATITKKISKTDGLINQADPDREKYLKYLAYEGWPGTYFFIEKNGKQLRIKITDAEFADGQFIIKKVIPEGKKEMEYKDFVK